MTITYNVVVLKMNRITKWIMYNNNNNKKLELSCAKLRPAWASYNLAFVKLAITEAVYYA